MHVSFRNVAAFASLSAAAALSWYFSREPAEAPPAGAAEGLPLGYYLRDATLLGIDESGRVFVRIHAAEAVQGREQQGLSLTGVRVEYRDEEAVDWSISADRATTRLNVSCIDLEQVRLEGDDAAGRDEMIIESAYLRLDTAKYLVTSDAPVSIRVGGASIAGVGIEARLRDDLIELKSEVHGSFSR